MKTLTLKQQIVALTKQLVALTKQLDTLTKGKAKIEKPAPKKVAVKAVKSTNGKTLKQKIDIFLSKAPIGKFIYLHTMYKQFKAETVGAQSAIRGILNTGTPAGDYIRSNEYMGDYRISAKHRKTIK